MGMHKGLLGQADGGASCDNGGASLDLMVQCAQSGQMSAKQIAADKTLSDYLQRKYRDEAFTHVQNERNSVKEEKKLTFDIWFAKYNEKNGLPPSYIIAKDAWQAGQENK